MCKKYVKRSILISIFLCSPIAMALPTGDEILVQTDLFRTDSEPERIEVEIKNYKGDKLENERMYQVYNKTNRRTLVLSKHPKEKGQKILMVDGNFWIIMPRSKRPIRITPRQRMLGNAAMGDITSLAFSEDYSSTVVNDALTLNDKAVIELKLLSKADGTTYDQIDLWVSKDDYFPIMADFYYKSGKLAKRADFMRGEDGKGETIVSGMVLHDRIRGKNRTVMKYNGATSVDIPDKYFNPSYLIRTKLEPVTND